MLPVAHGVASYVEIPVAHGVASYVEIPVAHGEASCGVVCLIFCRKPALWVTGRIFNRRC